MGWKFWRNKKSVEEQLLEVLTEEVSLMNDRFSIIEECLQKYDNKLYEMNQHLNNNEDLIQKSLRLQYKSSQEILKKMEPMNERMDKMLDYKEKYIKIEQEKDSAIKEKNYILERYIQWLDDIDLICDKLNLQEQEYWVKLLQNWQKQILKSLDLLGIHEVDVLGKSFNSTVAESVSTIKKKMNKEYMPYEIVNILQRGFIFEDGTLLRKAKVISIEEEDKEENEEK